MLLTGLQNSYLQIVLKCVLNKEKLYLGLNVYDVLSFM